MKKTFSLILLVFLSLAGFAQKEHLPFQGIPIGGDIVSFSQQLSAQGWQYSEHLTEESRRQCSVFSGRYAGMEAALVALHRSETKTVYQLMLMIHVGSKAALDAQLSQLQDSLLQEHKHSTCTTSTDEVGNPATTIQVFGPDQKTLLGSITLLEHLEGKECILIISYDDAANTNK
ncbi:MAG: hypothetical protein KBT28_12970 [Bacteroidales bacterium]|nr:hypothetical protein [Candidatus Colimorpha merdihippi]